jgi:hypothetical protein
MLDPHFQDPKRQQRLSQQKMEAIQLLMSGIIPHPSQENIDKLKKVMGVLDTPLPNIEE